MKRASKASKQPSKPGMMKEGKKEADEVNPTGNRLHLEAAPTLTHAHPDDKVVAGGQPEEQDIRERAEETRVANSSEENQKTESKEATQEEGQLRIKQPCKKREKGNERREPQQNRDRIRHRCERKRENAGLRHSRKQGTRKTVNYPSTYADADMRKEKKEGIARTAKRNGGGVRNREAKRTRVQTDQAIRNTASEEAQHRGGGYLVGSLKIGETERLARQHDATQTQEAAPLPPMQSAHIHRTSSSNGLIAQADSGLARHEHHQSECTQSLLRTYASTTVEDNLARHVNQPVHKRQAK